MIGRLYRAPTIVGSHKKAVRSSFCKRLAINNNFRNGKISVSYKMFNHSPVSNFSFYKRITAHSSVPCRRSMTHNNFRNGTGNMSYLKFSHIPKCKSEEIISRQVSMMRTLDQLADLLFPKRDG